MNPRTKPGQPVNSLIISLSLLTFAMLIKHTAPTLFAGDGGELITSAYLLGNAHPPGYPLYLLLSKFFTLLPLGNIAFRVNLLNTFIASVCVPLCYLFAATFLPPASSVIAAMIFFGSSSFITYSLAAEVYHVEILLLLIFLLCWRNQRKLPLLFLLASLGLTAHYGFLLVLITLLPFILLTEKPNIKGYVLGLFCGVLGFMVFIYLPLRASQEPKLNWGNPVNLTAFIAKLTRSEYHETSTRSFTDYLRQLYWALLFLKSEIFYPLYLLIVPGVLYLYQTSRKTLFFLGGCMLSYFFLASYFLNYQVAVLAFSLGPKFYLPVMIIATPLLGAGFQWLLDHAKRFANPLFILVFLLTLLLTNLSILAHSLRTNTLYHDYGADLFKSLPPRARLLSKGDNALFAALYLKEVENQRPDVTLTALEGNIFADEFGYRDLSVPELKRIERTIINKSARPIFYSDYTPDLPLTAQPLLYRLRRGKVTINNVKLAKYIRSPLRLEQTDELMLRVMAAARLLNYSYLAQALKRDPTKYLEIIENEMWDVPVIAEQAGQFYFKYGNYDKALKAYEQVVKLDKNSYSAYNQIGLIYKRKRKTALAKQAFNQALKINADYVPALYNLAAIHFDAGEFTQALKTSEQAYQKYPDYTANLYLRGLIYIKLNDKYQASANLERFLKLTKKNNPWHPKALKLLQNL